MREQRKQKWLIYLFWILLAEGIGGLVAWLTRDGMEFYSAQVIKPALSPAPIVFPIVWGILYALMGIGAARVSLSPAGPARSDALQVFLLQLGVNFAWSIVFFELRSYLGALILLLALVALVLWMMQRFRRVDRLAAGLQIPYLLWGLFAAYLNLSVWLLNR